MRDHLLDTNVIIGLLNGDPGISARMRALPADSRFLSAVALAELRAGAECSRHRRRNIMALEEAIQGIRVIAFDEYCASTYGLLVAELRAAGTPIGAMDLLIAATALRYGMRVVTDNTREFYRVPGLVVENWQRP